MTKRKVDKAELAARLVDARTRAKLTQEAVAMAVGVTQQSIQGYEGGKVARPGNIVELATVLRTTPEWLLFGDGSPPQPVDDKVVILGRSLPETLSNNARIGQPLDGFAKVPLRGQAMGGRDGALLFDSTKMGSVAAPSELTDVSGAYAVYVVGKSMENRFRDGEVVFVHPFERYIKGDDVVIQVEQADGQRVGWIKEFVSKDDKTLKVLQHNPKKTLTFDLKTVASIHKIIMSGRR